MKEEQPEGWNDVRRAMEDVISSYQKFVYNVTELCDLLEWNYEYMFSRLMPIRRWDRTKTTHLKEVFASLEGDMKESMFAAEKRRKIAERKRELMDRLGLTEEEIDEMLATLNT